MSLSEALASAGRQARHGSGCYRWYGDGRCVDCGRYTGTARDVVEVISNRGVIYSSPAAMQRSRLARLVGRATNLDDEVAPPASRGQRFDERTRTADQTAVQQAWREWRRQQGDLNPEVPRRQRAGNRNGGPGAAPRP